jgi:hypothetical protein
MFLFNDTGMTSLERQLKNDVFRSNKADEQNARNQMEKDLKE